MLGPWLKGDFTPQATPFHSPYEPDWALKVMNKWMHDDTPTVLRFHRGWLKTGKEQPLESPIRRLPSSTFEVPEV